MTRKIVTSETFLSQLREVVQLPSARSTYAMTEKDIADKIRLIDDVSKNFEQQLKIDYKAYEHSLWDL